MVRAERRTATGAGVAALRSAVLALVIALGAAVPAGAYVFNDPTVRQLSPETVPFDWSAQKCTNDDIPDQPARAFREANGTINFIDTHHTMWRNTTSNLVTLTHRCSPIMMGSHNNTDPSTYDDKEWLAAPWTSDGVTVHSLVHSEYQGWRHASGGYCIRSGEPITDREKCWQNAITLATSTNGGSTFSHAAAPAHLVAAPPWQWTRGGGIMGFFQPSHIVRGQDGFHYFLARVMAKGPQPIGSCLMRSRDVSDPTSWRGWSGSGFTVRFPSPYLNTLDPAQHVCQPVTPLHIGTLSESLGWSTYFKKWMLVGASDNADGSSGPGFYFFLSDDLINWSVARNVMRGPLPWAYQCNTHTEVLRDPSLLDPLSKSRNFDTIGQRPYLFFTRFHLTNCSWTLDRDLVRIPIEFSNQQPGGPSAALTASTTAARAGETVTFDASRSRDADGSITRFEWDLDGNGTYERDTGTNPVTQTAYGSADSVTVTVRVSDDAGKFTDDTVAIEIGGGSGPVSEPDGARAVGRTSAAAAGQAMGRLRVVSARTRRGGAVVRVRIPAAGTLRVAAGRRGVFRARRVDAARAGLVAVRIKSTRGRGMRTRARFVFTPVGGAPQVLHRLIALRAP
jgi:VCBS repeat-containing protein